MGSTNIQWCETHGSVVVDEVKDGAALEWLDAHYGASRDNSHRLLCECAIRTETMATGVPCVVKDATVSWEG